MRHNISIVLLAVFLIGAVQVPISHAQSTYSIKEMTPEAKMALENRKGRFDQLVDLKKKGIVGENNKGYVEVLAAGQGAEDLVTAENQDRQTIYKTISEQNGLGGALDAIEKIFADVQREKAQTGDKIQDENGVWITK